MTFWRVREELSRSERLRRSYYELLRDDLEQFLLDYSLVDSYNNFITNGEPYPFVEKRELKPRARIPDTEYKNQNVFLVIFVEDVIPQAHKKYIRFFDVNKTTKTNLLSSKTLPLGDKFDRTQKYLESDKFFELVKILLPVDYALLIQRKPDITARDRYCLTHFHVKIDYPITDAAEDLAKHLRYISKDIYEKGDKYGEDIQKKFFEYHGLPVMAGGRRSAAIVAAHYLRRVPCITTVYVSSAESRGLLRLSERGISKAILMKISEIELNQLLDTNKLSLRTFRANYEVACENGDSICIFQTSYLTTEPAKPPDDGKLRELKPDLNWLSVDSQYLLPKPGVWRFPPLKFNIIYS